MIDTLVSYVIPTFNGLQLLQKNLPSVLKSTRKNDEVLIIDDASTDGTVEWLRTTYALQKKVSDDDYTVWQSVLSSPKSISLKLIVNHQNLRFGASCNRAVKLATQPFIFLLNNDVVPEPDVVSFLLPHFGDPTVFAVGCHEIEENNQGASAGKNRLWFERGMFIHSRASNFKTGETAWASGGSALFDRAKWLELGGFDPRYYPAYWEDVDLSFRARRRGWKILFEAKAVVHHNHETTNTDVFGQTKMKAISWRNARTFSWTHTTLPQKVSMLLWTPYWWLKVGGKTSEVTRS